MKTKKIILIIITLALVCVAGFSGLVGAFAEIGEINVLSQPFDDLFPPQSSDYYYFYFDFSNCGISSTILDDTLLFFSGRIYLADITLYFDTYSVYPLSEQVNFSLVYEALIPKSLILSNDFTDIRLSFLFPDLTSYGIPSIDEVSYLDSQDTLIGRPTDIGSNTFYIGLIPSAMRSCVVTFGNSELALLNQYNTLQVDYNTLNSQYTSLQGQYNTLEGQYNILNTQYTTLQGQYNSLQIDYEDLYNDWEEERDSKEHYQALLREANNEIDNLENQIYQLELILDEQPVAAGFGWITYAFEKVGEILSIELLPDISIGLLALIPLVLGVVFFVLRLIRGE